jgi:hypothetical protein
MIHAVLARAESDRGTNVSTQIRADLTAEGGNKSGRPSVNFAQCFLRLANLPNFAFDRLSRYEAMLWRSVTRESKSASSNASSVVIAWPVINGIAALQRL